MCLLELEVQMSYIYVHLMVAHLCEFVVTIYKWHVKKILQFTEKNIYKPLLQQPLWYCLHVAGGQHYHFKMNNASKWL